MCLNNDCRLVSFSVKERRWKCPLTASFESGEGQGWRAFSTQPKSHKPLCLCLQELKSSCWFLFLLLFMRSVWKLFVLETHLKYESKVSDIAPSSGKKPEAQLRTVGITGISSAETRFLNSRSLFLHLWLRGRWSRQFPKFTFTELNNTVVTEALRLLFLPGMWKMPMKTAHSCY